MNSQTQLARLHAFIDGRVQGVGFRYFVSDLALAMQFTGWVRNTYDGRVEVTAEGERAKLEKLLEALHRGPHSAVVIQVDYDWLPATGEFASFSVRSTI